MEAPSILEAKREPTRSTGVDEMPTFTFRGVQVALAINENKTGGILEMMSTLGIGDGTWGTPK